MKRRTLSLLMMLALTLGLLAAPALADTGYPLHQGTSVTWQSYLSGSKLITGPNIPGSELGTDGTVFWHFVNPDKLGGYAEITFNTGSGSRTLTVNPYKDNMHFGVITPPTWTLTGAAYYPAKEPGPKGTLFNLSHTAFKYGALHVSAAATKEHEEITLQPYQIRDVQHYFTQTKQFFFTQTRWLTYSQTVQKQLQRETQATLVPVFRKEVSANDTGTLVTLGGTAWGNGHNYVTAQVGQSYSYQIATTHGDPIGYGYRLSVSDQSVTVSLDDRLVSASVAVNVFCEPPAQTPPGSHVTLDNEHRSASVALPDGCTGTVYVQVHFAGGIQWFTTGEYAFVEWRTKSTWEGEYKELEPLYGQLVDTGYAYGDKVQAGDPVFGAVTATPDLDTYGDYYPGITETVKTETVQDTYDVQFGLLIVGPDSGTLYDGPLANKAAMDFPSLMPGTYTLTLTGADISPITKTVQVPAGQTASVSFDGIKVTGPAIEHVLPIISQDNVLSDIVSIVLLEDHIDYNDLLPVTTYIPLEPPYVLPDIVLPAIYLGNETDPYHEHAIRLN